jgi:hypothetical protein
MTRENSGCVTGFNETPRQGCAIAGACAYHNGYRLLFSMPLRHFDAANGRRIS